MGIRARKAGHPQKLKRTESRGELYLNAALASLAFLIGVWLYFYIDRIPVAKELRREHVEAKTDSTVVISGLKAGPLLSINLRNAGRMRLTAEEGAEIVLPSPKQLSAAPGEPVSGRPRRTILDIYKSDSGNAGLDFELQGNGPIALEILPVPTENGRNGFHITPRGGALLAHALMIAGGDGSPGEMKLMTARRSSQWDEATILIPDGKTAKVFADDPLAGDRGTVIELPVFLEDDPLETGRLLVAGIAVGDPDRRSFDTLLCGTRKPGEKRFWPPIFPTISFQECDLESLALSSFDPFGRVSFDAKGTAFVVRDGKPEFWGGLSTFIENPLISKALQMALIGPLFVWLGFSLNALRKSWRRTSK